MFTFRVEEATGRPATDLELYMGMPGHAVFISHDRRVFAHVHPSGSAPMAAMQIGERSLGGAASAAGQDHTHAAGVYPPSCHFRSDCRSGETIGFSCRSRGRVASRPAPSTLASNEPTQMRPHVVTGFDRLLKSQQLEVRSENLEVKSRELAWTICGLLTLF